MDYDTIKCLFKEKESNEIFSESQIGEIIDNLCIIIMRLNKKYPITTLIVKVLSFLSMVCFF